MSVTNSVNSSPEYVYGVHTRNGLDPAPIHCDNKVLNILIHKSALNV